MDVKQAVGVAKEYLADLLSEEKISGLTLEEVWFDEAHGHWCITLGVHRPLNRLFEGTGMLLHPNYKVIRVREGDGKVLSVKNRDAEAA